MGHHIKILCVCMRRLQIIQEESGTTLLSFQFLSLGIVYLTTDSRAIAVASSGSLFTLVYDTIGSVRPSS